MSKLTEILKLFCYDPETDGNLTFNVTEALTKNWEKIDAALAPLGGATTTQAALAALGAGVRQNELDNAYFVGGGTGWGVFSVNQRCVSGTISTPGYFIDRWKLVSGTVQITAAGLVLNGTIAQILPSSIGSVYTATALTTTGIETCQYDDVSRTFTITGMGQTFIFAKLERGVGQTAAYQDADSAWRLLPQSDSDYTTQLVKCQAYQLVMKCAFANQDYSSYLGTGFASSATQARIFLPTPVTMHYAGTVVQPTIDFENLTVNGVDGSVDVTEIVASFGITEHGITLLCTVNGNLTQGSVQTLRFKKNGYLLIDAN